MGRKRKARKTPIPAWYDRFLNAVAGVSVWCCGSGIVLAMVPTTANVDVKDATACAFVGICGIITTTVATIFLERRL